MKAKGEEYDKNMSFDVMFDLVVDRAHSPIAFEVFKRFFDLGKQHIKFPNFGRIFGTHIRTQQVIGALRSYLGVAMRQRGSGIFILEFG